MERSMAEITASLVKELREKTGAGMMDCKKALGEVQGDIEKAVDWLRTKGLSAASKKAGRVAAATRIALDNGGDLAKVAAAPFPGAGRDVQGELTNLIATIGENMSLRRAASLSVSDGVVVAYTHNSVATDLGK